MQDSIRKADILIEALPYIQAFRGKVMVAKYGGSALDNVPAMRGILQDLVFLSEVGIRSVLVHGGGPAITRKLEASGRRSVFIDGMRVTDRTTVRVVDRELSNINGRLVQEIRALGGRARGLAGGRRVIAASAHARAKQLGYVGTVRAVRAEPIRAAFVRHGVPVISPIGQGPGGQLYNINADDVASEVAVRLGAEKLVLFTNVRGILRRGRTPDSLISTLTGAQARRLLARGVIAGGMIPKVRACVQAVARGVKKTHIIDAGIPHAMLLEIFTKKGIGTEITR